MFQSSDEEITKSLTISYIYKEIIRFFFSTKDFYTRMEKTSTPGSKGNVHPDEELSYTRVEE